MSLFWYALLCVLFSFAIILKKKRELVALFLLAYRCLFTQFTVNVLWLFLRVQWVGLQCVIWYFLIILTYFCLVPSTSFAPDKFEVAMPKGSGEDTFKKKNIICPLGQGHKMLPSTLYYHDIVKYTTAMFEVAIMSNGLGHRDPTRIGVL